MWRYGQDAVLLLVDEYDSTGSNSRARISVQNNSFQPLGTNAGNIAARLFDANGRLIETQVISFANSIPGESVFSTTVNFDLKGAYVIAGFEFNNSVIGFVRSYNPQNAITIQLMQGNIERYRTVIPAGFGSGIVEQRYIFHGVVPGTYTVVMSKDVHARFTIEEIVVVEDAVNLERDQRVNVRPATLPCGDITGSGSIGIMDLMAMLARDNFMQPTHLAHDPLADLDGDGVIGIMDLAIILNSYNWGSVGVYAR
jgi:hypothetical protein